MISSADIAGRVVAEVSVDLDRLAGQAMAELSARLPAYEVSMAAGGDDARAVVVGSMGLLLGAIRDRELVSKASSHVRQATLRRSLGGMPLDVVLEALAIQRDVIAAALEDRSRALGLAERGALVATRRLEQAVSAMVAELARGYMEAMAGRSGADGGDALVTVATAVNRSLDVAEVAQAGLAAVCQVSGACAAALLVPQGPGLQIAHTSGLRWGDDARLRIEAQRPLELVGLAETAPGPVRGGLDGSAPFTHALAIAVGFGRGRPAVVVVGFPAPPTAEQADLLQAATGPVADALARAERHRREARTDRLTALPNRHEFDRALSRALAAAERHQRRLAILLLDLDGLKAINDGGGHAEGDAALRRVGNAIRACIRATDTAARIGGDEFAVAMPDGDGQSALALAGRVAEQISAGRLRISAGVAEFTFGMTAADLFDIADRRLYEDKRAHRTAR